MAEDLRGGKAASYEIVDGQQRILSFAEFKQDKWPTLSGRDPKLGLPPSISARPSPWGGKQFSELTDDLTDRFLDADLQCIVVTGDTTDDEVRDLFIRLQAGTALTRQQVRDAWPGAVGPYIERLAGKKTRRPRFPHLFKALGRWGRGATDEEIETEDLYHDDRQTCAQLLLLFLSREGNYTDIPSLISPALDDLYHMNITFDAKGPQAQRFEEILGYCQGVVANPRGSREKIRKLPFFSLFLFFQDISSSANSRIDDVVVRSVMDSFWSPSPTAGEGPEEPSGRASSPSGIASHFKWFSDVKMRNVVVPWLDRQRFFSESQKEEAWNTVKGTDGSVKCAICEQVLARVEAQFDHIKPWSRGGPTTVDNCRPLHPACNLLIRPPRAYH